MKNVTVYQTKKEAGRPWNQVSDIDWNYKGNSITSIKLFPNQQYQQWLGFGGAFTEAAAYNWSQLSETNKSAIIHAYFNKETGLGYNLGRTAIHSSDFALGNYTYVEEGDVNLETFNIEREQKYVLPFIQAAESEAQETITILASPWSPPAWMKTNNEMNNGGKLLDEYREAWANYYVKYVKAMEAKGVAIWGISVQNEPEATQVWDSCIYTAEEERDFVKNYLGPIMEKNGLGDKKIIIWDHNRDVIVERATTVLSDPEAAKYVWGTGNHWYVSEEFANLSKVHEAFPDKHLLFTEGCIEGGVKLGAWHTGERYARNIIGDMNNWLEGFIDWNLVLDMQGGPNHVGNYCDAPIIVDTEQDDVHFNSSYYYIGHFSKFIKPGAKRIAHETELEEVSLVAFRNEDESIAVVLLNETEMAKETSLELEGNVMNLAIPGRCITTVVFT
ncbi:Glucuronoxylanase XynC precursor [Bacillus sp. THAF10]|uniref:glycoside hydrolase family 30 protein n=1 Tax=Bacillus sp. THAF10 TaxID=2587848 RepID=UPI0012681B5C|nr:glycoside hydrolase family 30 protein [Bacillus sp. THAF10]QFT90404.1 Glucuronoxylanase XynC precursor [Bacillus sp. THAF10]